LKHSDLLCARPTVQRRIAARFLCGALVAAAAAGLVACGEKKEAKSGQALASVNGEEITAMQLNEELQRAGLTAAQAQQPAATKQMLDGLIERQLVVNAAMQEKLDRDPNVVRAIERAKAQLIAQAYLQKKVGTPAKPTAAEVDAYFTAHPEFFSNRKQLEMRQLLIASDAIDAPLKAFIDSAKSLDEVAAYLDAHQIKYVRNQIARSTADLPAELSAKLLAMPKGQLFIVKEGPRNVLSVVTDVKDAPIGKDTAAPQIEQFLVSNKAKEAATAEVARLRAGAKIEYLNKATEYKDGAAPMAPAPAASSSPAGSDANARGVAGLK
jgi:EpsD family peptidyl-prolyl cis-trans isomerase